MRKKNQIFISYARSDSAEVEEIYERLSLAGFRPWMDKKDILPGEDFAFCIKQAIKHSNFFLACLSSNSVNRRGFIQREIKTALDLWEEKLNSDIYLVPVRLEPCEAPVSLSGFQWIDLFGSEKDDNWEKLLKALQTGARRTIKKKK
jgi:hypothetical protein